MNEESVLNVLSADAFWTVNKALARAIGIEEATFTAELLYKYRYWRDRGQLDDQGGFFFTSKDAQAVLGVSDKVIERLTKSLVTQQIFYVKKRGTPAKNYWYANWENIKVILSYPKTGVTTDPEMGATTAPQTGVTTDPQKGVTITKKSVPRKQTKDDPSLYRKVVECFTLGYEKLEGSKLSWVGKEKAYGNAVNTVIKQARSINPSWTDDQIWSEVRFRAASLLRHIELERTKKRSGGKGDEFVAKLKFVPTTLMNRWNDYPAMRSNASPVVQEVEIPEEELRRHAEVG